MDAFSWNAILNFGIPIAFYYEGSQAPGRHLTGLLTHQGGTTDRWYSMEIETKWNKFTQSAPFRKQNKRSSFFKCFFTFFIVLKLTFHLFDRSGDTC